MKARSKLFVICGIVAFSLGALFRPWLERLFWKNPLRPVEMVGAYVHLMPPGTETYRLEPDGTVICISSSPLVPYSKKHEGLWQMAEPNICFVTLRKVHQVVGPVSQAFFLRADLDRSDVVLFQSLQEARDAGKTQ